MGGRSLLFRTYGSGTFKGVFCLDPLGGEATGIVCCGAVEEVVVSLVLLMKFYSNACPVCFGRVNVRRNLSRLSIVTVCRSGLNEV